ncbi:MULTISPECIES: hypothetical protein [unclassified Brevibacterium]|uniref:hypothetical protein n=1 Tax=unclassified Brevibacterium TaxID=2614124 RepID=UPI001093144E|nr:hypothetical protein [Brevibacterium sp. S22]TGD29153.1 hypothetical protein EB835_16600 [Brevibacterium sp. S22]
MYTLLNNTEASKFDLYLPGQLVASLHYTIAPDGMMFVYCEAIEPINAERHCRELMRLSLEDSLNRRLPITVSCPIARRHIDRDPLISAQLQAITKDVGHKHQISFD